MKSRNITNEELKAIQLDILKDVDMFCAKNGIRYSLAFGTLLGAIRHKGYIPWDDDIDIMMPRKDYDKFIDIYSSDRFKVICHGNCPDYQLTFAKVYCTSTVMNELSSMSVTFGVYIDVFPVDNYPSDPKENKGFLDKKKRLNYIHDIKTTALRPGRKWYKNFVLSLLKVLLYPVSYSFMTERIEKLCQKYSIADTGYAGVISPTDNKPKWRLKSEIFDSYSTAVFEDAEFSIIENYDEYLKSTYGDYMTLPPQEQQVSHHQYNAYYI